MAFLKLNNAQLFYQWDGPENAPVVVFSNSLGTTHRMWDPQLATAFIFVASLWAA